MEQDSVWVIEWKSNDFRDDLWHPIVECFKSRQAAREGSKWFRMQYPDCTVDQFRIRQYVRKV